MSETLKDLNRELKKWKMYYSECSAEEMPEILENIGGCVMEIEREEKMLKEYYDNLHQVMDNDMTGQDLDDIL